MIDQVVELFGTQPFGLHHIPCDTRVQVPGPRPHGQPGCGSESHTRIDALSVVDRGEARPISEMSQNHASRRGLRARRTSEFLHEESVRQPVEAVSLNSNRFKAAGDRQ